MLWDPVQQRVSGVLDFESVAVGDPHIDFSWWVFLDEELLQCAATAYVRAGPGRLSVERCWLYGAVCDLSDAVWRTERGYPVDDGPITARVHRIRARLPGAVW
jgi:aminoglycoside phosphotransferase (APT) family kinase protein